VIYSGDRGLDLSATARFTSGHPWAAGVFSGYVPATQIVNANVAFQARPDLKLFLTATNVLDDRRFQIYGGSVVGRRMIAGVTATF
jgi:hypothetical protein